VHSVGVHDYGNPLGGLCGIGPLGLGYEVALRDPAAHQIIAPDAPFAEAGIRGGAARRYDNGSKVLSEQVVRVIEAGSQHRRRPARILSGTEHDDRIG
jgi:hypothetical protein